MFSHRLHQTHLRLQHTQPLRPSPRTRTDPHFGFIYCADRPIELFFQLVRVRSNDIHLHDEVEFYVGPSSSRGNRTDADGDKLSAYAVRLLEPGTIQWEVEDEPIGVRNRGRVERVSRVYTRDREWNLQPHQHHWIERRNHPCPTRQRPTRTSRTIQRYQFQQRRIPFPSQRKRIRQE